MVKVKFLKRFGKFQPGDVTEVTDAKAYYWRKIGVAEPHFEVNEEPAKESAEKATKNKKPEKVQINKPPNKKRIKKPGSFH